MNILLIDHYAGSEKHGMEFRPYYLAREWQKRGHCATIVACSFSHLRKVNPEVPKDFYEEEIDGIRYVWIKANAYSGNGAKRVLNMTVFYHKLKCHAGKLAEKYRPDAVIASSTYPFDIYAAAKIAKRTGAKLCFEIHDLWPLSPIELYGFKPSNPIIRYLQRAEDFAFHYSDVIASVLPDADKYIQERGFDTSKFVYVPNGIVPESAQIQEIPNPQRDTLEALKKQEKFIVMYAGGFKVANAVDDMIASAEYFCENGVLVLVGDGQLKADFESYISENDIHNIVLLPSVPKAAVYSVLQYADCLFIAAKRTPLYRYGVSMNKLYDYMLASKPIIYAVESSNNPVEEANCGITVEAENPQAAADAINRLAAMLLQEREQMGKNGVDYVLKNHEYSVLAERFVNALK